MYKRQQLRFVQLFNKAFLLYYYYSYLSVSYDSHVMLLWKQKFSFFLYHIGIEANRSKWRQLVETRHSMIMILMMMRQPRLSLKVYNVTLM